ncbi:unnamed protein product [Rotaria sordida]|uniref:Uncharacterized protein n=1 Tax=Rotaria sordida TaxID=392033 RepID=A0A813PGQ0_9BILA|nr:unnamed protein product [Rotaria sordida]CAF0753197.1 unnamed protein product [Rotaria sordida]
MIVIKSSLWVSKHEGTFIVLNYFVLKNYFNAVFYYQKTLHIRQLPLPKNHPVLLKAIENHQNTITSVPRNGLQSISEKQYSQSKLSKLRRKLNGRVSNCVQTIKRKH